MAHEISFASLTGQAEAVYRNVPAWHGLGRTFQSEPGNRLTSEIALAMAGLDWEVGIEPLYLGDGAAVGSHRATVRKDTGAVLGVVGNRYMPFQNREAFAFLDSMVADGMIEYEAAFALRGGSTVVLLARMPGIDEIAPGDDCMRYLLCSTSHDGTAPIYMQPTTVRVQCANMLRLALSNSKHQVSIKHTGKMEQQLAAAKIYLSQFDKGYDLFREQAQTLVNKKYNATEAGEFFRALYPEPDQKTNAKAYAIWANRFRRIVTAINHPSNQLPAMIGTWWQLLNAITFDIDHESRTRGKSTGERNENRFLSVSNGPGADLKDRALSLALEMAA